MSPIPPNEMLGGCVQHTSIYVTPLYWTQSGEPILLIFSLLGYSTVVSIGSGVFLARTSTGTFECMFHINRWWSRHPLLKNLQVNPIDDHKGFSGELEALSSSVDPIAEPTLSFVMCAFRTYSLTQSDMISSHFRILQIPKHSLSVFSKNSRLQAFAGACSEVRWGGVKLVSGVSNEPIIDRCQLFSYFFYFFFLLFHLASMCWLLELLFRNSFWLQHGANDSMVVTLRLTYEMESATQPWPYDIHSCPPNTELSPRFYDVSCQIVRPGKLGTNTICHVRCLARAHMYATTTHSLPGHR